MFNSSVMFSGKGTTVKQLTSKNDIPFVPDKTFGLHISCSLQGGWTALHFASAYGHPSLVDLLIKSGSKLDIQDKVESVYTVILYLKHYTLLTYQRSRGRA